MSRPRTRCAPERRNTMVKGICMTHSETDQDFCRKLQAFALEEVDRFGVATVNLFDGAPAGTRPTELN